MSVTSLKITADPQTTQDLKYLNRVKTEIPVIKLGCEYVARLITGLRQSSTVVEWSLNKASSSVDQVVKYPLSYVKDQLSAIDQILCISLDLTELNLPVLTKTPQEMYEESVDYVLGMVAPITDWVDVELLPPAEYYVDQYLPELDTDQKIKHLDDDEKGSRASQLAVKFTRRVVQHAHAEPKYIGKLICTGYEESILLIKILIFDSKLIPKTLCQIWKKLGDGVTPDEQANSLLLVEMGCKRLRKCVSLLVKTINMTEEVAICYIGLLMRYLYSKKNNIVDNFLRNENPTTKIHTKNMETQRHKENTKIETKEKDTSSEPSTST